MTQLRCSHSHAYETFHSHSEDSRDKTHWYCPDCDSYFPLIGNTDHWIKYLTPEQELNIDSQTIQQET